MRRCASLQSIAKILGAFVTITYRICSTNEDFARVTQIEKLVWNVDDIDAITVQIEQRKN